MASRKQPILARYVLDRFAKRRHLDRDLRRYELAVRWHELVGERIASRTTPGALKRGQLTVVVNDSAWFNELAFLKAQLTDQINARLGEQRVREIRLVAGKAGSAAPPATPPKPAGPVRRRTDLEQRADGEVPPLVDEELRQRIVRARGAQLSRDAD